MGYITGFKYVLLAKNEFIPFWRTLIATESLNEAVSELPETFRASISWRLFVSQGRPSSVFFGMTDFFGENLGWENGISIDSEGLVTCQGSMENYEREVQRLFSMFVEMSIAYRSFYVGEDDIRNPCKYHVQRFVRDALVPTFAEVPPLPKSEKEIVVKTLLTTNDQLPCFIQGLNNEGY